MKRTAEHNRKISEACRGSKHWRTNLNASLVRTIFDQRGKITAVALAMHFALNEDLYVSEGQIYSIWSGRTWSHVTGRSR